MSAVNQVTADGSPDFLVQDVPPVSAPGLGIEQPRIYYGELGTGYSLVNTKEAEFDYPGAGGDVYTKGYSGSGGVPISPLLNRLAFAAQYGTIKFFTTSALKSDSRIIFRNDIRERIQAAAPFLGLDPDPYMVIADGKLYWIQDAYTQTSRFPYSTPEGGLNYLRNSVKVVVDAYNGSMKYYVWDEKDPLLRRGRPSTRTSSRREGRCRRRCSTTCATRRASSTSRPRCGRPTTWTGRRSSTTGATSGRSPTTWRSAAPAPWRLTT